MNKQIESIQSLTDAELLVCKGLSKLIPWPVDIDLNQINVPEKQLRLASQHIHVRRLVNDFKFSIQSTIV